MNVAKYDVTEINLRNNKYLLFFCDSEMNDNSISWTMEDVSGAFLGLQKLMKLGLKMNHIKSITNQAFLGLQRLRQLHLEHNDITTIQENSFQPLQDLREL